MVEVIIIAIILFAFIFLASEMREEWRAARRRKEMRHILGGKQWWGKR